MINKLYHHVKGLYFRNCFSMGRMKKEFSVNSNSASIRLSKSTQIDLRKEFHLRFPKTPKQKYNLYIHIINCYLFQCDSQARLNLFQPKVIHLTYCPQCLQFYHYTLLMANKFHSHHVLCISRTKTNKCASVVVVIIIFIKKEKSEHSHPWFTEQMCETSGTGLDKARPENSVQLSKQVAISSSLILHNLNFSVCISRKLELGARSK